MIKKMQNVLMVMVVLSLVVVFSTMVSALHEGYKTVQYDKVALVKNDAFRNFLPAAAQVNANQEALRIGNVSSHIRSLEETNVRMVCAMVSGQMECKEEVNN